VCERGGPPGGGGGGGGGGGKGGGGGEVGPAQPKVKRVAKRRKKARKRCGTCVVVWTRRWKSCWTF